MLSRRFYSQGGFNIAEYVNRIQNIAAKQQAGTARQKGAKGNGQDRQKSGDKVQANSNGGAQGQKKRPFKGENDAQRGPNNFQRKPQGFRPQSQSKPNVKTQSGAPQQRQGNQGPRQPRTGVQGRPQGQFNQRRTDSAASARPDARKPAVDTAAAATADPIVDSVIEASIFPTETTAASNSSRYASRAAHQRSKPKKNGKKSFKKTNTRLNPAGVGMRSQVLSGGHPLVMSAQEGLDAILGNSSSGFITVSDLSPRAIGQSLTQGQSYNARVWSVINASKPDSDVSSLVSARINGEYKPLMISDESVSESLARTLNANPTLTGEHKQFLARVAAGNVRPSDIKQMRM